MAIKISEAEAEQQKILAMQKGLFEADIKYPNE